MHPVDGNGSARRQGHALRANRLAVVRQACDTEEHIRTVRGALPYRYFALSNLGSLVSLLSYPALIEPYLTGHQQAWLWSMLFGLFAALCIVTAVVMSQWNRGAENDPGPSLDVAGLNWRTLFLWIALPACASALPRPTA